MHIRKIYMPYSLAEIDIYNKEEHPLSQQVRQLLQKKGFFLKDAQDTAGIREAILRLQKAENLAPTGRLDPRTYCRLCDADVSEIIPVSGPKRANMILTQGRIFIKKSIRQLTLLDGNRQIRIYPVAIGKPSTPTPEGDFSIAIKILNPGGILGTRWMGLNFNPDYGIHGNNAPWSIGTMASKGCVRMHNNHVEELFTMVRFGTPVIIRP